MIEGVISNLKGQGFMSVTKQQEKYKMIISADDINSTDNHFTINNLYLGNNYKPLKAVFKKANGATIERAREKGERSISNQTLPRIAFQIFEKQIIALAKEEKEQFPICQYASSENIFRGIYSSIEEFRNHINSIEYLTYRYADDRLFVIYCWNIFSTLHFVQECLKRFGEPGDYFELTYREKDEKETTIDKTEEQSEEIEQKIDGYRNPYSSMLIESKNIIFRGAPGTGKSYLAKEIAADIISNGYFDNYTLLSDEQKQQVEFVQFHPSYDYSDFVEGLRPKINDDGTMGFELQDGVFKRFIERARSNYENSQKSRETIEKETNVRESMAEFFSNIAFGEDNFKTVNGSEFTITGVDDKHINISIPGNASIKKLSLNIDEVKMMLESGETFNKVKDITNFFGKVYGTQEFSYDFAIYKAIKDNKTENSKSVVKTESLKKYIFIIDEINRGEISKIFGELFFAIDPGYRGRAGEISTQYSNLHSDPDDKLFVPENVYIIGTMNDIDRSVDSFDFAMRRRFRFIEIKADEQLEMLDSLENEELKMEAISRMTALNKEIANVEDLNENYQIGAAYFLKLKHISFDQLWTDYLYPLLQEYIHGMYDESGIMSKFAKAYGYEESSKGDVDGSTQN
ncbi:MAG: AAA family ATPase [Selenomonadales bacterium]|nr:AAA family ATPase [Selenomonadales bacterium]